jgi:catechol 2,3-dioxygenase-like lactoylglutathione lyase family enzyme
MMNEQTIKTQNLRVSSFDGLTEFYRDSLGMQIFESCEKRLEFGFSPEGGHLVFHKADVAPFVARPDDFYWKIGITLRDLSAAVLHLRSQGLEVTDSRQFRDIGYLSKVHDPCGFIIELLQQGFEGNEQPLSKGHRVGAQATLAHITLRVTDIESAKRYFGESLGMRLMSVQPVDEREFCLYFYGWSDEVLPNPGLESPANREWLWARPYTLIELQHLQNQGATIHKSISTDAGFEGFSYGPSGRDDFSFVHVGELGLLR